jgi:hypothetical protein
MVKWPCVQDHREELRDGFAALARGLEGAAAGPYTRPLSSST